MTSETAVRAEQIHLPAEPTAMSEVRHELRTYLNHIVGYLGLVVDQAEELRATQIRRNAEQCVESAGDLTAGVADLLRSLATGDRPACAEIINSRLQPAAVRVLRGMGLVAAEAASIDSHAMASDAIRVSTACRRLMDTLDNGLRPRRRPTVRKSTSRDAGQPDGTASARRSGSLMAVDDNPENLELFSRFATRRGHRVLTVRTGEEALREIEHRMFDLIVLDIMLPGVDGFEVLRRMKSSSAQSVPVIVLSSLDDLPSMATCLRMGAEDFMRKPFVAEILGARIDALLNRKQIRLVQGENDSQQRNFNPDALSPREVEVLSHLAMGKSNREIGNDLYITENTVVRHVNHIFTKAGLQNRAAAGVYAASLGLARMGQDRELRPGGSAQLAQQKR